MLDPTRCIRLATSLRFDTFQQRPTMLDNVRSVWPGLYGLMKRYYKYSHTETPVKFEIYKTSLDFIIPLKYNASIELIRISGFELYARAYVRIWTLRPCSNLTVHMRQQ